MVGIIFGDAVGFLDGCTLGDAKGGLGEGGVIRGERAWGLGVSGFVLSSYLLKISRRLSMAMSWALMLSSVASLMVVERKLIACRSLSS